MVPQPHGPRAPKGHWHGCGARVSYGMVSAAGYAAVQGTAPSLTDVVNGVAATAEARARRTHERASGPSGGSMSPPGERRVYAGSFLGVLVIGAAMLAVVVLKPFLAAIAWAIVIAVGVQAPWRVLDRRLAPRRSFAAGVMCLGVTLGVILPAGIIGSVLFGQATHAVTLLRDEFRSRPVASVADVVALPWVTEALRWVEARTGITPHMRQDKL